MAEVLGKVLCKINVYIFSIYDLIVVVASELVMVGLLVMAYKVRIELN